MIRRVYEQACKANGIDVVVVATDDARIEAHVREFGGRVVMTGAHHPSGTDRCAEVARMFPEADYILNIQGDEPFIQPEQIELLIRTLTTGKRFPIATLVRKLDQEEMLFNPNVVKAVFSEKNGALYFSRHPIPYVRGVDPSSWPGTQPFYKHIGLYGFRRSTLLRIARLKPTPLEKAESLEQLRWLENGLKIAVGITDMDTVGIDTPEDLASLQF
jgi:3-deoxy-manno-octulosonate cytidylyltransferase (CMP-KDO synthetase)